MSFFQITHSHVLRLYRSATSHLFSSTLLHVLQMNTFEHLDPGCNGSPQHSEIMLQHGYHHLPHDDMPNSVGSDFPTTPSELSSPMSQ